MKADIAASVRYCPHFALNRLRLILRKQPMCLIPATKALKSGAVYLLRPMPKTRNGNRFILVIADRFTRLRHVAPMKRITGLKVAKSLSSHWVFKYGAPKKRSCQIMDPSSPASCTRTIVASLASQTRSHRHTFRKRTVR